MMLADLKSGSTRKIKAVFSDKKVSDFLFSLGCAVGEEITLISKLGENYIIALQGSRYAVDKKMARAIELV